MDNMTKRQRSLTMSRIRSKDTRPECRVRSFLYKMGYRYKKNVRELPGSPDIVLRKYNSVIFINGCFWHHHEGCSKATMPKTNKTYWREKLQRNAAKDNANSRMLNSMGWRVITIWECEINQDLSSALAKIIEFLNKPIDF
jgi:DNA mismatch endonuclease, patch repair protein